MATKTTAAPRNASYLTVKSIAYGMFVLGLALSVTHIYGLFTGLGAGVVTAAAAPVFVDGLQLIGRLARGHQFAAETRRMGLWVQLFGASVSLAANVIAGHSTGDKIAGALFVGGYVFAEWFADRLRPVEVDVKAQAAAAKAASIAKAQATRKANAQAKAQAAAEKARKDSERKERARMAREIAKVEAAANGETVTTAVAPVSPAPVAYEHATYI